MKTGDAARWWSPYFFGASLAAAHLRNFQPALLIQIGSVERGRCEAHRGRLVSKARRPSTPIQNDSKRLLISQDFLPKSVTTKRLRRTLRNKGFSRRSVTTHRGCGPYFSPFVGATPGRVTLLSEQTLRIEPDDVCRIIAAANQDGRMTICAIGRRSRA